MTLQELYKTVPRQSETPSSRNKPQILLGFEFKVYSFIKGFGVSGYNPEP